MLIYASCNVCLDGIPEIWQGCAAVWWPMLSAGGAELQGLFSYLVQQGQSLIKGPPAGKPPALQF